jgi:hypothetical protein
MEPGKDSGIKEYPVLYGVVPNDEFNIGFISANAYASLGYPLSITRGAEPSLGKPASEAKVFVDSKETSNKLNRIQRILTRDNPPIRRLLSAVAEGKTWAIPHGAGVIDSQNVFGFKGIVDDETLSRCYLRAAMREIESLYGGDEEKYIAALRELNPRMAFEYEETKRDGITPIDSDGMGSLLVGEVKKVLEQHPELNPTPKK